MKKSVIYSTKKGDKLKEKILSLLSVSDKFLSTQDISNQLGKPWHSVQTRCLMLQVDGKVNGFRIGRINLWQINKGFKKKKNE
jgi:hypothetical protein